MEIAAIIVAGIILLAIFALLIWVFWKAARKTFHSIFGTDVAACVLGFGLAVLCIPEMVGGPINALVKSATYFLGALPQVLAQIGQYSSQDQPKSLQNVGTLLSNTLQNAAAFSFTDVVLGIALWVLATRLLEGLFTGAESGLGRRIRSYFAGMTPTRKNNAALAAIIALGCYLTIAAITAVPWLQQTAAPAEIDTSHLTDALKALQINKDQFNTDYPPDLPDTDPFKSLHAVLASSSASASATPSPTPTPTGIPAPPRATTNDTVQKANEILSAMEADRKFIRSKWGTLRQRALSQQDDLQTTLSQEFNVENIGRVGTQEKARYFGQVLDFYQFEIRNIKIQLSNCRDLIQRSDSDYSNAASYIEGVIRQSTKEATTPEVFASLYNLQPSYSVAASQVCEIHEILSRPVPVEPGSGWGIFRFFVQWLMKTESLALAVICGMVGAGLLGSAVSSFLQKGTQVAQAVTQKENEQDLHDLVSIVVRGFSAAIVVYLAVRGGMAAVGSGNNDPNPYVLLFLCLIGTVYSDDVWQWAREKFKNAITGKDITTRNKTPEIRSSAQTPSGTLPSNSQQDTKKHDDANQITKEPNTENPT